jgi:YidC/Oxa1 family membrane protein insertase
MQQSIIVANVVFDLFQPLVDLLRHILRVFESWTGSWGVAIILLTMVVRTAMLPLTIKQYRSTAAMQALQPKIKELQRKHKGDKQKLQQETMKLYQEHRVNPLASCLPTLLQLPIFICLYYAIRGTQELKLAGFLWIPAGEVVSRVPYKFIYGLGNPDPYYILFVLYIVTQMISTELMMAPETEKQQKMIMRAMLLFFVVILYKFPSGLFVYWVTTNVWTIGQQIIIRRRMHGPQPATAPGKPKKESRLMKALTEAQQRQQERVGSRSPGTGDETGEGDDEAPTSASTAGKKSAQSRGGAGQRQGTRPGRRPVNRGGKKPGGQGGKKPGGQGGKGSQSPGDKRP